MKSPFKDKKLTKKEIKKFAADPYARLRKGLVHARVFDDKGFK